MQGMRELIPEAKIFH